MYCWIGSLLCGLKGQDYFGQGMGIETKNISTLVQQEGIEEIKWRVLEMRNVIGVSSKVILQECWLTTLSPFFFK